MAAASAPGGSGSGPPADRGSAAQLQPTVAVWEWADDLGYWRPYSGQVSGYIERCLLTQRGGGPANTSISLGQADPALAPYIIDIPSLKQFRQDTGKMRSVRRSLFPQCGALGSGVSWEWANDEGGWTPYEMQTTILLEQSYQARQPSADLGQQGYSYVVNLAALVQVNKTTGFRRQIRRKTSAPYPAVGSVIHSGPACSCLQCMANSGTGPMPSRTRHSFSAAQSSKPSLQVYGRAPAASPTPAYSPYPKRPLSVGNMSWGGPWHPVPPGGQPARAYQPNVSNGLSSIPSVPVQLNGPSGINSALAGVWKPLLPYTGRLIYPGMASILMSAAGLRVRLTSAPPPQHPSSGKASKSHSAFRKAKSQPETAPEQKPEDVIQKYMEKVDVPPEEDCLICMERLSCASGYDGVSESPSVSPGAVGKFTKCGHFLHLLCMLAMYNTGTKDGSLQCPSCKTIYGEKTGTQPKGKMEIYRIPQSLPGHPDCGTIQIIYNIPPGIQGPEHPNPGKPYSCRGFPRLCFLPDSDKGRKVLELLKVAWTRRLIFTVGTSNTTGEPDTVVWNEIHHKTEMMSNVSGHGYPDPNYLDNVLAELAAQGVTEACLKQP
ncbi:probable E3 ubiquitin-protein ligase DTX2 isoform X1 [Lepisosteus oculatus]|uniref:probable E3 ubiquitin-protein ligase DTX2 isoform X1 n=1 Tax=Lepisosteus oculatus TaxID=7918 RepID=UPI0007400AF9|nr:PREDICTED: probable E3 ubiquitin-protein ligase DTX2 isoform X1 [Lepisosteus oculatus]XP_015223299.1 PREDICTED: probable E3 ubiquitin-protein ligase DTX2 isoform X1 [Lepisosteus oculatus]